jgi:peptide methionine sulfoxide reductase msrA/msrB
LSYKLIFTFIFAIGFVATVFAIAQNRKYNTEKDIKMKYPPLSDEEIRVILHKGTESPFSGTYLKHSETGTYTCRQCGAPLFSSKAKFDSKSGWPSFDEALQGAVLELRDADGMRTEIVCAACKGHLGHVFKGEGFTGTNTRHCVNSISLNFTPFAQPHHEEERAIFAGGCFWGVEYLLEKHPGVIKAISGYTGGHTEYPNYEEVCYGITGHIEAVEVSYDPSLTTFEALARLFFEIHDPTQHNRQGPDVGEQYKSAIFYLSDAQKETAHALVKELSKKGFDVATKIQPATRFWPAEDYHQDYFDKKGTLPYCRTRTPRF